MPDEPSFRRLCEIVREVAERPPLERGADLWAAIKVELVQRHLPWTPLRLTSAINAVEQAMKTDLSRPPMRMAHRSGSTSPPSAPVSASDAKAILGQLGVRVPGFPASVARPCQFDGETLKREDLP